MYTENRGRQSAASSASSTLLFNAGSLMTLVSQWAPSLCLPSCEITDAHCWIWPLCVSLGRQGVYHGAGGSLRTTWRASWFSPSTMWVLRINLGWPLPAEPSCWPAPFFKTGSSLGSSWLSGKHLLSSTSAPLYRLPRSCSGLLDYCSHENRGGEECAECKNELNFVNNKHTRKRI